MRALRTKLRRSVQNGRSDARYTNLIVQLKDLENINKVHMHYIDWLRKNCSVIRLPTLFSEIFDIPISSTSSMSSNGTEDEFLVNDLEPSGRVGDESEGSTGANQISSMTEHIDQQDFFFNLTSFQDTDDKIEAADLNPTVDCSDVVDQLTSQ